MKDNSGNNLEWSSEGPTLRIIDYQSLSSHQLWGDLDITMLMKKSTFGHVLSLANLGYVLNH